MIQKKVDESEVEEKKKTIVQHEMDDLKSTSKVFSSCSHRFQSSTSMP